MPGALFDSNHQSLTGYPWIYNLKHTSDSVNSCSTIFFWINDTSKRRKRNHKTMHHEWQMNGHGACRQVAATGSGTLQNNLDLDNAWVTSWSSSPYQHHLHHSTTPLPQQMVYWSLNACWRETTPRKQRGPLRPTQHRQAPSSMYSIRLPRGVR